MAAFGLNLIGYAHVLHRLPLAVAYPAYVGTTLGMVLAFSFFILHERLVPLQILGIMLIATGIVLAVRH